MPVPHATGEHALVLSVRQPWADLIVAGKKTIEIRSWTDRYRGPLWIHASRMMDKAAVERFRPHHSLPTGALVGRVELVDIVPLDETRWSHWRLLHLDDGPVLFGAYGFVLTHPRRLSEPRPLAGQLKFFSLPPELADQWLEARLEPERTPPVSSLNPASDDVG